MSLLADYLGQLSNLYNDGIYYATWLEFFNSVVIHNLVFPNTAYNFLGFIELKVISLPS
ncbi:hypothetical protein GWR21_17170 [Chitinophaga agri]|uniref:Uncharacterized protein n=1 Tax=Chitinophaga agri TaxID=2703787 RepID=A0A6B9ZJL3_9BACT|nr:hypothetical protein GWR21_17170 [Chitinophaga agri]